MKYKLIGRNDFFMPMETALENRNITKSLFNLDSSVVEDYNNYDNIEKGIKLLISHLDNNDKIEFICDSDVDGGTSFSVLYRRIKDSYPNSNLNFKIHTMKQHGLSDDISIDEDTKLVIIPDAGSNDFEQCEELHKKGVDILILDHHICDKGYCEFATVINNQLSKKVNNKNLSGVGVVYKFCKALDDYLFEDYSDKYLDLVALGNVADMMDLNEKETRYFVKQGLKNIKNTFIKAMIEANSYELEGKYNIEKIGWVIAPKINGTIRSGSQEEKLKMYKAFISDDYEYCLEIAKMCKNIKSTQDRQVKSSMNKIIKSIQLNSNDKCVIINVEGKLNQSHTGLVAQKIEDKYKLPTLLYRDMEDDFVGGSFRGNDNISTDLRQDILNSELVEYSQGHEQAGGFKININNLNKLKEYFNNLYKDKVPTDTKSYDVDFILSENELDNYIIDELASYEDEFGNCVDIPLIAFENMNIFITDKDIKRTLITFYVNGIKFVKKFPTNVFKEQVKNKEITVNIIGKCTLNTYSNCGQVEIVDLEII